MEEAVFWRDSKQNSNYTHGMRMTSLGSHHLAENGFILPVTKFPNLDLALSYTDKLLVFRWVLIVLLL